MSTWQFAVILAVITAFGAAAVIMLAGLRREGRGNAAAREEIEGLLGELEKRLYGKMNDISEASEHELDRLRGSMNDSVQVRMDSLSRQLSVKLDEMNGTASLRYDATDKKLGDALSGIANELNAQSGRSEERFKTFEAGHMERLRQIDATLESNLRSIRESTERHLEKIRGIVDEKLQSTLNERITESFKMVNERLKEVHAGLGEMQALAAGVGDLKRVLSNVKTRGTLGEIQLGAILEEVLAPEQFERNFDPGKHTGERVEFAIRLPNDGQAPVYLPVDSKFPMDMYMHLVDSYDSGDAAAVEAARKGLRDTLQKCAKDVRDKYINPPKTTDFAILFLPTEGLYAEAVRLGLVETLQRGFKVNIAGPSTMAALLNSLQMGFRTLAIQKRSSEVWDILAKIKKEFTTFDEVLSSTRKALDKANNDLEKLVGVRTRKILSTLKDVETLPQDDAVKVIAAPEPISGGETEIEEI